MKTRKTVIVPAVEAKPETTKEVEGPVRCDLCGRTAPSHDHKPWAEGAYDVTEPVMSLKTGHSYPEGGSGETLSFDVCPTCFEEKVIPWMASQGATPRTEDWDW